MKNLKVDWMADNPWDVEVAVKPIEREPDQSARVQSKATKRIVITASGVILRQCVRAM